MARIGRTGGAGTAGRNADPLQIKKIRKSLPFHTFKIHIDDARIRLNPIAVEVSFRNLHKAVNQSVIHMFDLLIVFRHVITAFFQGYGETNSTGNVLCSRTFSFLLLSAMDQRIKRNAASYIQGTDAFRPVELMARDTEHIDLQMINIDSDMTGSLHCVRMKKDIFSAADQTIFADHLNCAGFIVEHHDGNKAGVFTNCVCEITGKNDPFVSFRLQKGERIKRLKPLQCFQNSMMLNGACNNMGFSLLPDKLSRGFNGKVIAFRAAGSKINFICLCANAVRHCLPRVFQSKLYLFGRGIKA